jgi:hypothetical protein
LTHCHFTFFNVATFVVGSGLVLAPFEEEQKTSGFDEGNHRVLFCRMEQNLDLNCRLDL